MAGVITRFDELKLGIADWENFIKCHPVFSVEINNQFNSFLKVICDLAKQALLARVDISTCRAISSLKNVDTCI